MSCFLRNTFKGLLAAGTIAAAGFLPGNGLQAQALVNNNGAVIGIKPGAVTIVKTGSFDNIAGTVDNGGTLVVEGDYRNGDTTNGGGTNGFFRVQEDWINDGVFVRDNSEVELYGANQQITGNSITGFYDLTLTGTGIKTQTLDAYTYNNLTLNDRELATDQHYMFVENTDPNAILRTTGFVSSTVGGRLARATDATTTYLFPVGSSAGATRYRPVELTPTDAQPQTYEVRMANVDATTEGFDRSDRDPDICEVNELYYHHIGRYSGAASPVDLTLFFDPADGNWSDIAHWQVVPRWEIPAVATAGVSAPFNTLAFSNFNDFTFQPFAFATMNPVVDTANAVIVDPTCYAGTDGSIDITVTSGTGVTFEWAPNNSTSEDLSGIGAGTYTLTITDVNGCNRNGDPYTFVVDQPDSIELTADVTAPECPSDSLGAIDLIVNNAVTPIQSYDWSNNATTQDVSGLPGGTYDVEVTDANGCKQTLVVEVIAPEPIEATTQITDVSCYGESSGAISLTDVTGGTPGNPPYRFEWSHTDSVQNVTGLTAGTYTVTIVDGNKCKQEISGLTVEQPDSLGLTASADTSILIGFSTELEVLSTTGGTGSLTYEWTPAGTLSDPTGTITTATPNETTVYLVNGTDENGCVASDSVRIIVDLNALIAPDGFTPNGSGDVRNNRFYLIHSAAVTISELKIFNRWGQVVSDDPTGWDGTYKGKLQPMDTYVWQAVAIFPNGEKKPFQGNVILIR